MYLDEYGVKKNAKLGIQWLTKTAENSCLFAIEDLGLTYDNGRGVKRDPRKAAYWYQHALESGGAQVGREVLYNYGRLLKNGEGVRQNNKRAFELFQKAANLRLPQAYFALGLMYHDGEGVRQNKTEAKEWFGKACDEGFELGCKNFKYLNEKGY